MSETWRHAAGDIEAVGEFYAPVGAANGRAVLVIHEADGIGGNVRRHCRMLAELGYAAAAADMHGGGRVLEGAAMAEAFDLLRGDPGLLRGRVAGALAALRERTGLPPARLGAIGYCFGGYTVLELARSGADLAAVASFHGVLTTRRPADPGTIRPRILACTGDRDPIVPPEDVTAFQAEMRAAEADWQLIVHGRALHSFTNVDVAAHSDPRMGYDPAADRLSWAALLTHLDGAFGGVS
ncbi:dienelactone hydrolase [Sphingomonas vulcanisoli]|uniref:Dienelactone hydrolase n=1 Tax=Sphingomonas vulcanisoli TaxID=1658060 RepID=A0ABX0TVC0_9SPHN|nr:dienelactone hydrolase [Sphingomonas vulcanisoli]